MIIKAKFIGANGSLGYIHGKQYHLTIKENKPGVLDALAYNLFLEGTISIKRLEGGGVCPYTSLETFLDNWTNIQKIDGRKEKND